MEKNSSESYKSRENNFEKSYEELVPLENKVSAHQTHLHIYAMGVFNSFHNNVIIMALILNSYHHIKIKVLRPFYHKQYF